MAIETQLCSVVALGNVRCAAQEQRNLANLFNLNKHQTNVNSDRCDNCLRHQKKQGVQPVSGRQGKSCYLCLNSLN